MTGCIVGWSHTPFGKHENEDVESLIVHAATEAVKDAGFEASVESMKAQEGTYHIRKLGLNK